jgi:hypothetical protein
MEKTEKKLITRVYNNNEVEKHQPVNFNINRFDSVIIQKGYNVIHYRALKCPCMNRETHSPLPNCQTCSGLGWFYIDKKRTKALVQNMTNSKKFENWTESNPGTATITTMFVDDVTYMDKFEIEDLESNFSQVLFLQKYNDKLFAFSTYSPLRVMNIYMFNSPTQPLIPLYSKEEKGSQWDYYIEKNKIFFNKDRITSTDVTVTVRYKHTPVYCITDIQRELFKTKSSSDCGNHESDEGDGLTGAPQKSIGRRLHYVWNADNLQGLKEYDNTDYTKVNKKDVSETIVEEGLL